MPDRAESGGTVEEEDYCALCLGPCSETELWRMAGQLLGAHIERLIAQSGRST